MSTYIKSGKNLEFDNAPDWLVAYMRHRRTLRGNTPNSVMTDFIALREFLQWLAAYRKTGKSPSTKQHLREVSILDMLLEDAVAVTRNDIETYLYFCADTLGNGENTRTKKLVMIRCFYNYLLDQQEALQIGLKANPAERILNPKTPKKQPILLPEQERTSLLDSIDGENATRDYAILLLLMSCGLRVSEVVNITMKDVNMAAGIIKIHGKGNKERLAYPTPTCINALQEYLDCYRQFATNDTSPNAYFFVAKRTGKKITTRAVELFMQKHVNAAGIGGMGYTPHKLRHTTATMLAKDGVDLLAIQQILGHESPTTTQIYTHLGNEDIERAVQQSSLSDLGQHREER